MSLDGHDGDFFLLECAILCPFAFLLSGCLIVISRWVYYNGVYRLEVSVSLLSVPSLDLGIVPMYLSLANGACISLDSLFFHWLLCFLTQGHRQNSFLG